MLIHVLDDTMTRIDRQISIDQGLDVQLQQDLMNIDHNQSGQVMFFDKHSDELMDDLTDWLEWLLDDREFQLFDSMMNKHETYLDDDDLLNTWEFDRNISRESREVFVRSEVHRIDRAKLHWFRMEYV